MVISWIDPLSICLICVAFCDLIWICVVLVLFMLTTSRSLFLYMLTWMIELILGLVNFLTIPTRVQLFLWLMSKNKILTRDNLEKRKKLPDLSCLFCAEGESVNHLFGC
jgi:hypothetical protein